MQRLQQILQQLRNTDIEIGEKEAKKNRSFNLAKTETSAYLM